MTIGAPATMMIGWIAATAGTTITGIAAAVVPTIAARTEAGAGRTTIKTAPAAAIGRATVTAT